MAVADDLIRTTVRIEAEGDDWSGRGTGFLFFFNDAPGTPTVRPALITNHHVVAGAHTTRFELAYQTTSGEVRQKFVVRNSQSNWVPHPGGLDLAMLPLADLASYMATGDSVLRVTPFYINNIADLRYRANLTAIEDVIMIGYPTGLWDEHNNLPLVRSGITATSPKVNFGGRPEFVIDCACWPGSSGSPVLHYARGAYVEGTEVKFGEHFKLLGILHAGPVFTAEGEVKEVTPPKSLAMVSHTDIMINLGYCIRADALLAFADLFPEDVPNHVPLA